jgi:hypothetical protein
MKFKFYAIVFFTFTLVFSLTESVSAHPASIISFPIPDENAIVYDENGNGIPDMTGDTWIFNRNQSSDARLIIRFRQTPALTAFVYDDVDGNGRIDFLVGESSIQIIEPDWRVQVIARNNDWSLPGGLPDWNLDIQINSNFAFISGVPVIPRENECGDIEPITAIQLLDRNTSETVIKNPLTFQVRYWDLNNDGIPDYEWRNVQDAGPFDILIVNKSPNLFYKPAHRFPLLDTVLWMDPSKARIQAVRPLIPERASEASYVLRFDHAITPGSLSDAIENPTAYYNFQDNHLCIPDLTIHAVSITNDQLRGNLSAYNQIRYSWVQNGGNIRYRLFLMGQVFTSRINVYPVFSAAHIPYEDLPSFVLENNWVVASFAEMEDPTRAIPTDDLPENPFYITSLNRTLLRPNRLVLPEHYLPVFLSLREEYNLFEYNRAPQLYESTVDHRLHLRGAQEGIIIFSADTANASSGFDFSRDSLQTGNLVIKSATTYSDTDSDGYIDTWIYQENGKPVTALVIRPDAALLALPNSVMIKSLPVNFGLSTWEAAPPATNEEWGFYNDKLEVTKQIRRPLNDLAMIFSDLPGDVTLLPNTSLTSISTNGSNLFAQIATSGFSIPSNTSFTIPAGEIVQAGNYVLHKDNDKFLLEPVVVMPLQISPLSLKETSPAPIGQVGVLFFSIRNPGNLDVKALLRIWDQNDSAQFLMQNRELVIPAYGQVDLDFPWMPISGGSHRLIVEVDHNLADGQLNQSRQELEQSIIIPDSVTDTLLVNPAYLPSSVFMLIMLPIFFLGGLWVTLRTLEKIDDHPIK